MLSIVGYLSALSPRTRRLFGTAAAGYLARVASALTMLLTIPLARSTMPPEVFGVWMMLGSLLTFFSFADLGVGNGLLNKISESLNQNNYEKIGQYIWAGYATTLITGGGIVAGWFLWIALSPNPLAFAGAISTDYRTNAIGAFSLFVCLMALNISLQLIHKCQLAFQDGHWVGLTQLGASVATVVLLPLAMKSRSSLSVLLYCTVGTQSVAMLISAIIWMTRRNIWNAIKRSNLEWLNVLSLFRIGAQFLVLQMCAAFAFQSDSFVIVNLLGTAAYGDYAAIQKVFFSIASIVMAGLAGMWPAFSEALANREYEWVKMAYRKAIFTGALVIGGISIACTVAIPWLSRDWLGMAGAPPYLLASIFSLWTTIDVMGQITASLLNGAGVLRAQLIVAVVMAALAFCLKWIFVAWVGAWGAVLATLVAYVSISIPIQIILVKSILAPKFLLEKSILEGKS